MIDTTHQIHRLKTWTRYWDRVSLGEKQFELRKDDRDFQTGDIVVLVEISEENGEETGNELVRRITYVLRHDNFYSDPKYGPLAGLTQGYCVFGIEEIDRG